MRFYGALFVMLLPIIVLLTGCLSDSGDSGGSQDSTAPNVNFAMSATSDLGTGVATNGNISAAFSERMDPGSINDTTFTLKQGATLIPCSVTYTGYTASLNPTNDLAGSTTYTATITTGVRDLTGNTMAADKIWSFTTGTTQDSISPVVNFTTPASAATGVAVNGNLTATFSEWMNPATITSATFTLAQGVTPVSGVVTCLGTVATLNPANNLANNTAYTATITTTAKDLSGNSLAVAKTWSFTTGITAASGPAPVDLGTAGSFVILSKSGISTVPNSALTGDIGVSPIAASFITGFSLSMDASNTFSTSSQVNGNAYAADYTPPTPAILTTAVSNMETAYTDAAGRTLPTATELGSGNISGLTITPGLYKWGTGVLISTDVTLNGGANDVWIFQVSEGITMAAGVKVILTGGALPKNIFWQAFGAVTLNENSHLEGIILAKTEITLATGATVNGRLLSQTAVTLDQCIIAQPAQ